MKEENMLEPEQRRKDFLRPPFTFPIPDYLEKDIERLIEAVMNNQEFIDCEQCEIIGSANMALMAKEITEPQARWIQRYYGYGRMFSQTLEPCPE